MKVKAIQSTLVLLAMLGIAACTAGGEGRQAARVSAGLPTASATAPFDNGGCDETGLTPDDATRLRVYEAALRHVLQAEDRPAYLTNRPVPARGVSAKAQARQSTFSVDLLGCLASGLWDLPPLQPVTGIDDPRVVKSGPTPLARLRDGRLVEVSGLDANSLVGPAVVFVSLNGGGGFDYRDHTVRLEPLAGRWVVTKDLGGAIA